MIPLSELNIEYRGAVFSIVYGYIDNVLYMGGTVKSTVFSEININWSPCDEGDTIDTYIELLKKFIDYHHAKKALTIALE